MNVNPYPEEKLDEDTDDGTMPRSVANLSEQVIGRKIVSVESNGSVTSEWGWNRNGTVLVLDNGKRVTLVENGDCCAYTELEKITLNLDKIGHVITGVGTTDGYTTWHIYADLGDVVEMKVGWSAGNVGYYGYGFDIAVTDEQETT